MQHPNLTGLPALAEQVDHLAAGVSGTVIHAIQLNHTPPAQVLTSERHLWRWSFQLRRTPANLRARRRVPDTTLDAPSRIAVILVLDLTDPMDLDLIAREVIATGGPTGNGWQVVHTSVQPDPARLLLDPAGDHDRPIPVTELRRRPK